MLRTLARLEPPVTAPQPLRGPHRRTLALLLLLSAQVASQTLINANFSMAVSDLASSTPTATVDGGFESDAAVDRDAEMLMSDAVLDRDAERKAKARAHRRSVPADSLGSATPRRTAGSPSCPPTLPNDPRLHLCVPSAPYPGWPHVRRGACVYAANGSPKLRLLSERRCSYLRQAGGRLSLGRLRQVLPIRRIPSRLRSMRRLVGKDKKEVLR